MSEIFAISGDDFWVKVVGMLQQNWATIEADPNGGCRIYFVCDLSGVFDQLPFASKEDAVAGLIRNGFRCYADSPDLQSFLVPPKPPFRTGKHTNGPIYSSGRFWQ